MPRRASDIGAETFSAQVKYTGTKDKKHPNLVRVRILVPHFDGLLPAISTKQLSNFELTLSPDASRVAQHSCSNLLDVHEIVTRHSFLTNDIIDPNGIGGNQPYQYDSQLRGNNTLRYHILSFIFHEYGHNMLVSLQFFQDDTQDDIQKRKMCNILSRRIFHRNY